MDEKKKLLQVQVLITLFTFVRQQIRSVFLEVEHRQDMLIAAKCHKQRQSPAEVVPALIAQKITEFKKVADNRVAKNQVMEEIWVLLQRGTTTLGYTDKSLANKIVELITNQSRSN